MRKLARRPLLGVLCAMLLVLGAAAPAQGAFDDPLFVFDRTLLNKEPPPPYPPFEGFCGLGVDSVGNLYVSDYYHHRINIFKALHSPTTPADPEYITALKNVDPLDGPCGLALDAAGNLYVNNYHRNVEKFVPSSFPPVAGSTFPVLIPPTTYSVAILDSAHPTGVAVGSTGQAYVNARTQISVYDSSGALQGEIGAGTLEDGYGVAISGFPATAGRLYVPDAATDTVKVYDPLLDTVNPVATIDGSATPRGEFVSLRDSAIAVDNVSGEVYVADEVRSAHTERPETVVYVFDATGAYQGRLKYSVLSGSPAGLAVDNSATPTQGRVYLTSGNSEGPVVYAYPPGAATSAAVPLPGSPGDAGGGSAAASAPAAPAAPASPSEERPDAAGAAASQTITQKGTLRVTVSGELAPRRLPRQGTAPISVSVGGEVSTTDQSPPPKLKTLAIELNRNGHLDHTGLPICPYERIQPASTARALAACRSALVGQGSFRADITLAGQQPYPTSGRLLAFNGRRAGKPVLFAQIYAPRPFATSFVIVFEIRKARGGDYGVSLQTELPEALTSWGNLTGIEMTLQRRYSHRGRPHSYISAGCPAPKGFSGADFPLARTSFGFEGGAKLTSTLSGTCKVRG